MNMINPMESYDAIIIGSGQGGTPLAKKLAKGGKKTLLIEKRQVGGTCVNDGCTPTKALISSARTAYTARHSARWGILVDGVRVDFQKIMERKDDIVRQLREGAEKGLRETAGLSLLYGEASFLAPGRIRVSTREGDVKTYEAPLYCIDTGLRPQLPPIKGLETIPYLTSTTLLDLKELPAHLLILGGSYLGLEFAQMFLRFGSKVTLLEQRPRLLPKEDDDIADAVREMLAAEGVDIRTGVTVQEAGGNVELRTSEGTFTASHLLVATGRTPNTGPLDLAKAGIDTDEKGFIRVNDRLETSARGVYAIGDVKGGPAFTHIAYHDHLIVSENMLKGADRRIAGRQVPYCMFTDPQLGRIGMTEREAAAAGCAIRVARFPMAHSSRGIETGHTTGLMKAVMDKKTEKILGVAILGDQGGEVMSVLELAMAGGMTASALRRHVFAHPLYAESLNNLFMS